MERGQAAGIRHTLTLVARLSVCVGEGWPVWQVPRDTGLTQCHRVNTLREGQGRSTRSTGYTHPRRHADASGRVQELTGQVYSDCVAIGFVR